MMMGVGNLTELTDVDSAGVNTILAGALPGTENPERPDDRRDQLGAHRRCESSIWLAGWLITPSTSTHLPKHVEPRLVALRDPKVVDFGVDNLAELQRRIRDPNWRIFAEGGMIYALNNAQLPERSRSVCALRADGSRRRRRTRSTSATS